MAKIADSKGRADENSGYVRVVGSASLGHLLSRVQAAVIRNGNELERLLREACPYSATSVALPDMVTQIPRDVPIQVLFAYRHRFDEAAGIVGDVVVVDHIRRLIHVIELKDGDTFDTKKASGELASLEKLTSALGAKLGYHAETRFCAFNQPNKLAIVAGAKGRFGINVVMTGHELCDLIGVDYDEVRRQRRNDAGENFDYLIREMIAIPEVRGRIRDILKEWSNDN